MQASDTQIVKVTKDKQQRFLGTLITGQFLSDTLPVQDHRGFRHRIVCGSHRSSLRVP